MTHAADNRYSIHQESLKSGDASTDKITWKELAGGGPSIGTVRVLGTRGCDVNTQGWYLGKGTPDQYDYSLSEDGESLVVQANRPNLTGVFEFVHCADAGRIAGKRIRFSAQIKAENVTQLALIRFWGEKGNRVRVINTSKPVTGTYDWKDFSIEAEVDPELNILNYGVTFRSSGKLWIRHPMFSVSP